jgi:transposase
MSLPVFSTQAELFSTAGLSRSLFGPSDRYRLFAQKVYPVLVHTRVHLEGAYCADNGRVACEPVLLLGVCFLQYLEAVPDRQAVELLRYHAGWNFALNRQLGDEGFHPTTLVNFRQRLLEHELSPIGFEAVLEALIAAGLVARASRQRLDATQMFARVSRMSRLDCVRESLRLALLELAPPLTPEARPPWWPRLWERYVDSQADYRAAPETLARKLVEAGADTQLLLGWLATAEGKAFSGGTQVQLLARVFGEQFEVAAATGTVQPLTKGNLVSSRVQNPHDPDATYAAKGAGKKMKEHVGYKVQVAETVSEKVLAPGEPTGNFISGIVTHAAFESDEQGACKMAEEQKDMGMDKPPVLYVDGAYISTGELRKVQAEGRELIGPAPGPGGGNVGRFGNDQFDVQVEERRATCPAGQPNSQCGRIAEQATGKVSFRFEWSPKVCTQCPLRPQCIKDDQQHRTLAVGEHHTILQQRRQEQKTDAFKTRMKHRNAIEGTQSELVRAHGMRRARYRGLRKTKLQNYFIAAACNLKRWLRRAAWELQRTLTSQPSAAPAH